MTRLASKPRSWRGVELLHGHILSADPFTTGGAMRAVSGAQGTGGHLPREWQERYASDDIVYTVFSYATPIAWLTESHGWVVPDVKYSITTSAHQTHVRTALYRVGYSESVAAELVAA